MDLKLMIFCVSVCTFIHVANCGEKKVVIHIPLEIKKIKHTHTVYKTIHHKKENPHEHHHHHHHHHHVDDHHGHGWDSFGGSESQVVTARILPTKLTESSSNGYNNRGTRQTYDSYESTTPELKRVPTKVHHKRGNNFRKKH